LNTPPSFAEFLLKETDWNSTNESSISVFKTDPDPKELMFEIEPFTKVILLF